MGQLNDDMFDALANKQRRELLFALTEKVRKLTHQLTLIHHLTLFHPMK